MEKQLRLEVVCISTFFLSSVIVHEIDIVYHFAMESSQTVLSKEKREDAIGNVVVYRF